jgi:hypothetical protein
MIFYWDVKKLSINFPKNLRKKQNSCKKSSKLIDSGIHDPGFKLFLWSDIQVEYKSYSSIFAGVKFRNIG